MPISNTDEDLKSRLQRTYSFDVGSCRSLSLLYAHLYEQPPRQKLIGFPAAKGPFYLRIDWGEEESSGFVALIGYL